MTSEAERIAAGLTDRQKEAIIGACTTHSDVGGEPFVTVDYTDPWTAPIAQFLSLRTDRLNKLGLAVRSILTAQGESK